jgi:cell wall assembly regulator SMI1
MLCQNNAKYTDNQLIEAVATSHSIRTVLEKIGLTLPEEITRRLRTHIHELNLDTSHFLGQAILRNKTHAYNTRPLDAILVHGKLESTWRLKN